MELKRVMKKLVLLLIIAGFLYNLASIVEVNGSDDIFTAAKNGDLVKVKALLMTNARLINAIDDEGYTVLMIAACSYASQDNEPMVKLLISKGADVNAKSNDGQTALTLAIERGNKEIEKLLIARGARTNP